MLSDALKLEIQGAYSRLLESKGYSARYCQRRMVADIANTLGNIEVNLDKERVSDGHICVVEAGTGTGKTVAYTVAALPLARALGKRLVIATATVALQEQIVLRDLPDIAAHTGIDFSFAIAKGRRRYLCLSRLDQALAAESPMNHTLALYDNELIATDVSYGPLYESMLKELGRGNWNGERDAWSEEVDDRAWFRVSTDHVQCTGRQCSHFRNCCFYRAREQIHKVDCIVTNQDLVLSDLMMGGGAVLPAPEDTIYIFDEGHHLPDKAISHFSSFVQLGTTQGWLEQITQTLSQVTGELGDVGGLPRTLPSIEDGVHEMLARLDEVRRMIEPYREEADIDAEDRRYRFERGEVPEEVRALCASVHEASRRLMGRIEPVVAGISDAMQDAPELEREPYERWLPIVSAIQARFTGAAELWASFMHPDNPAMPPMARWITFRGEDVMLSASPVAVDETLAELLWSRCFGAIVTSATLAVGGDFSRYERRAGIPGGSHFNALPSPFRFGEQATLKVPRMMSDPRDADAHTAEVAELLPGILARCHGGLVLFTSWRQMLRVTEAIDPVFKEKVISQGTLSKAAIIAEHKSRIDSGAQSIIFGLASFAEGIDLPGIYCDHVVIAKIPFAVPDDPVGATLSEWIESRGGNSFQEIMVPDAALRMVQACGRLLRTEQDEGCITILDRRLVTQRYGSLILKALPPFKRDIA
ncbi:MAG: ATP-dependent DNA helicase DinG [Pseudomonadales bacterium]|nr:ATP-dependent DNA helicase DinG [Pseudomonadales bacterium]